LTFVAPISKAMTPCSGTCGWRVDIAAAFERPPPSVLRASTRAIPVVADAPRNNLNSAPPSACTTIRPRAIDAHLLNLGHRRIGCCLAGRINGATEQRISRLHSTKCWLNKHPLDGSLFKRQTSFFFPTELVCAERMLRGGAPAPTAIFACNYDKFRGAAIIHGAKVSVSVSLVSCPSLGSRRCARPTMIWGGLNVTTWDKPVAAMAANRPASSSRTIRAARLPGTRATHLLGHEFGRSEFDEPRPGPGGC